MTLLNHNIKIKDTIFHIQTEKMVKNGIVFAFTDIYTEGHILWSQRIEHDGTSDLNSFFSAAHKKAIYELKNSTVRQRTILFKIKNITELFLIELKDVVCGIFINTLNMEKVFIEYSSKNVNIATISKFYYDLFIPLRDRVTVNIDKLHINIDESVEIIIGSVCRNKILYSLCLNKKAHLYSFVNNIYVPQFLGLIEDLTSPQSDLEYYLLSH